VERALLPAAFDFARVGRTLLSVAFDFDLDLDFDFDQEGPGFSRAEKEPPIINPASAAAGPPL
jgi:hypothetical protein